MTQELLFEEIAPLLLTKNTQELADELLKLFTQNFDYFVQVINVLFIKDISNINYDFYSKQLTSKVLHHALKYSFCTKCAHFILKIIKRNQLYEEKLYVRDVIHLQKETSILIFLQSRRDSERRVLSKILRGQSPIKRSLVLEALAIMCALRYQYMAKRFDEKDIVSNNLENLKTIFDKYPNYIGVAQLLSQYQCDVSKVLKNVKVSVGYPVKQQSKNLKTFQVHLDCRNKKIKFFSPTKQEIYLSFDKNNKYYSYEYFKPFINVKYECILELEIEELEITVKGDENEIRYVIVYPCDVLLFDGCECLYLSPSSRRNMLMNIINVTPDTKRLTKTIYFSMAKLI